MSDKNKVSSRIMRRLGIILFWIVMWHLLALLVDNHILMVTPMEALVRFFELVGDGEFWKTICFSVCRIGLGFCLGFTAGLVLAVLSSRSLLLEEFLSPIMTLCKTIPVASFVVLLLIWWGSAYLAVAICFLIVLPNIYINTLEGIRATDKKLLEMAQVFSIPYKTRFFYMYRPALKPFLYSSLKLSLGMCWKSGVAAEVIGTPAFSIGESLYFSKIYLDTAGVFAWTAVIILLSVGFEKLILWLAEKFFQWEPACKAAGKAGRVDGEFGDKEMGCNTVSKLEVKALSKRYGELPLFEDFHAAYKPGETYYLTSPSGSGKTTYLKMLCGLEMPDGGTITPNLQYSVTFQEDRLCEDYSAIKNIEMITGDAESARNALEQLLDKEALQKPCSQLSGGMKRRVALIRAMEAKSDCVLLDEPFTGMDSATRASAQHYIEAKQNNRILIIATHLLNH